MKQKYLLMFGIATALSLTGCSSNNPSAETEALQEQITQLQQQISELEQKIASDNTDEALSAAGPGTETSDPSDGPAALSTTHTLEELTAMVSAYEEKTSAAAPSGSSADDMEQFLSLKQEEEKIDDDLDLHEDELEYLYRNHTLSREEYKTLERELERLEDRLDAAEDDLEYTFGIDD